MRQLKITKQVTNRETASLDKYLQEIGKVDLIMKLVVLNLYRMLFGGFVNLSYKHWQNNLELCVCH